MRKNINTFILTLSISLGLIVIITFLIVIILYFFLNKTLSKANLSVSQAAQKTATAYLLNQQNHNKNLNLIVLGLDKRDDQFEKTSTTDTILFTSINPATSQIHLVSLPRDLWSYKLNAKINHIYPFSLDRQDKFSYIKSNYSDIIGQPVDHVITISTQNISEIITLIGGVDIYLDKGFKDDKYPNPEYIKNPSKSTPIYLTVEFPQGWNHIDSTNIAPFVRSRKSAETAADGGTDIGRINRQQLLLESILSKLKQKSFWSNPNNIINLYNYWHNNIETTLTDEEIISQLFSLKSNILNIGLQKHQVLIGTGPKDSIIYHPDKFLNPQWVFIPSDPSYGKLKEFISKSISSNE